MSSFREQELGENSRISFQEWRSKNSNVSFTSLNTHQGMAVEVIDEVVSSFISKGTTMPSDLNRDLRGNLFVNDGSNACVFLCCKILDDLLKCSELCGQDQHSIIESVSSETIRELPRHINLSRVISEFAAVDDALTVMTENNVISTSYNMTELLKKQCSQSLQEKKNYLKEALVSLKQESHSIGKAFAIYLCPPLAILVGVIGSSFIIVDTHKVPEEVGGAHSGLLLKFDCEADEIDTTLESVVDWISMRMEASIPNYSTQLHSLTLLKNSDLYTGASLEFERNESVLPSSESTCEIFRKNKPYQGLEEDQIKMKHGTHHPFVTDEQNSKSSLKGKGNFDVSKVSTETEHNELVARASEPLDCARTGKLTTHYPKIFLM